MMYTQSTITSMANMTNITPTAFVNDTYETPLSFSYNLPSLIVVGTILFLLTLFTVFGNLLVGIALFKFRSLRTVSNFLIGNLALSDFLLALTILPLSVVVECLGYWVFGKELCNFWLSVDVLYCTASIWNLCIIAFDRFTATLYPLWYREKRSSKQAGMYIAFSWIISVMICIPPLLGWTDLSKNYQYDEKTKTYNCLLYQETGYVLYSASGSFFIPFFITTGLYIKIFMVLRQRMSRMRSARHQRRKQQQNINEDTTNTFGKEDIATEMTQMQTEYNSSGVTEEPSSRSLFSSATDSGEKPSDEENSESHLKSPNPAYISGSDAETHTHVPDLIKNRLPDDQPNGRTVVITNPVLTKDDKENAKSTSKQKQKHNASGAGRGKAKSDQSKAETPDKKTLKPSSKGLSEKLRSPFRFKRRGDRMRSTDRNKYDQREYRATIRMAIIIACFCGCWVGFFTLYALGGLCPSCYVPRGLSSFFFWLGYANSTMNPILYTIFNEEFRKAFQKLLGCYVSRHAGKR